MLVEPIRDHAGFCGGRCPAVVAILFDVQMVGYTSFLEFGSNDLKAEFRGRKYVCELLKLLPESPDELLISQFFAKIGSLGGIHSTVDS